MNISFRAYEFSRLDEAFQHYYASGRGEVIQFQGHYYVAERAEIARLESAGVEFAYLHLHDLPSGETRVVAVPVNGDRASSVNERGGANESAETR